MVIAEAEGCVCSCSVLFWRAGLWQPKEAPVLFPTLLSLCGPQVERQIRTSVQLPASTLAQDMVEASASSLSRGTSSSSSRSAYVLSTSPEASASSCSCYSTMIANAKSRVPSRSAGQLQAPLEDPLHQEHLGPCDCLITGDGWSLPAHKALLKGKYS